MVRPSQTCVRGLLRHLGCPSHPEMLTSACLPIRNADKMSAVKFADAPVASMAKGLSDSQKHLVLSLLKVHMFEGATLANSMRCAVRRIAVRCIAVRCIAVRCIAVREERWVQSCGAVWARSFGFFFGPRDVNDAPSILHLSLTRTQRIRQLLRDEHWKLCSKAISALNLTMADYRSCRATFW